MCTPGFCPDPGVSAEKLPGDSEREETDGGRVWKKRKVGAGDEGEALGCGEMP